MSNRVLCVGVLFVLGGSMVTLAGEKEELTTWADYHPELAQAFAAPMVPWKCEIIKTELSGLSQCGVVLDPAGELVVNGSDRLFHSTEGGRS